MIRLWAGAGTFLIGAATAGCSGAGATGLVVPDISTGLREDSSTEHPDNSMTRVITDSRDIKSDFLMISGLLPG